MALDHFSSPGGYGVDFGLSEMRQLIHVTQTLANAPTRQREVFETVTHNH
jgi:hypothetical protein